MRRKPMFLATLAVTASLGLTGCAGLPESSYDALGEGARKVFSVTLSVSAEVANWVGEEREEQKEGIPACPGTLPTA
jgi:hypothetical protein